MQSKSMQKRLEDQKPNIIINQLSDGWEIWVGQQLYHYNTNHEDMGTKAIAVLLKDLGFKVAVLEVY